MPRLGGSTGLSTRQLAQVETTGARPGGDDSQQPSGHNVVVLRIPVGVRGVQPVDPGIPVTHPAHGSAGPMRRW